MLSLQISSIKVLDQNIESFVVGEPVIKSRFISQQYLSIATLTAKNLYIHFRSKKGCIYENDYQFINYKCDNNDKFVSMQVDEYNEQIIVATHTGQILFLHMEEEKEIKLLNKVQLPGLQHIQQIVLLGNIYILTDQNIIYFIKQNQSDKPQFYQLNTTIKGKILFIKGYLHSSTQQYFLYVIQHKRINVFIINKEQNKQEQNEEQIMHQMKQLNKKCDIGIDIEYPELPTYNPLASPFILSPPKKQLVPIVLSDDQTNDDICLEHTTSLYCRDNIVCIGTKQGIMRWNERVDFQLIEGNWCHARPITSITYDKRSLVSISADKSGELVIYDVNSNCEIKRLMCGVKSITSVELSDQGILLIGTQGQCVKLYRLWCQ